MGEEMQSRRSMFWFVQGNVKVLMFCRVIWSASTSIVYPFFSLYILALGGTETEVGLINALGIIAGMVLYPVGGYIADRSGRVKLIGYSTFLYAFAHLFFVIANDWRMIALGQFMSQLLLFYMPAMNALEADSLPPGVRGRGFAMMMAVPGAVRVVAPVIGGYVLDRCVLDWAAGRVAQAPLPEGDGHRGGRGGFQLQTDTQDDSAGL